MKIALQNGGTCLIIQSPARIKLELELILSQEGYCWSEKLSPYEVKSKGHPLTDRDLDATFGHTGPLLNLTKQSGKKKQL